ncbi:MAG: extracellular solute-binding protein [Caldilineaceae bacterium]|nr:extracellular solute-binding protein [Caldilineaceae bacterium]
MSKQISRRSFLRSAGIGTGAVVILAACQPMPAGTSDGAAAAPAADPVTITSMTWGWGDLMDELSELLAEQTDGAIVVEGQQLGWGDYWTKLNTLYASGSPPDSAWTHTAWVRPHAVLGVIEDLNPRIDASPDFPDDWYSSVWGLFTFEGGQYGSSWDVGVQGMWYNRNLYEEAGLTGPGVGTTYADLLEHGRTLTTDRGGNNPQDDGFNKREVTVWGMSNMVDNWVNEIRPQAVAWGTDIFNEDETECIVNSEATMEFLNWNLDAIQTHNIHPSADLIEGLGNLFVSGSSALISTFPGIIDQFDGSFVWEISPYPMGGANGIHTLNVGGSAFSIPSESPHPEEAWQWVKFNASDLAHQHWAKRGIINARRSTSKYVLEQMDVPDTFVEFYMDRIDEFGVPVWQHKNRAQINTALTSAFELVWLGDRTVEDAANAVKAEVDEFLADA